MNKVWNDSLDPSQIAKVLEKNPNYQVYLRIWKADTEDELLAKAAANADNYDQRITLGWQEGTDAGTFLWTKDYTVAPGVMVKEGDTAAENIGLTKENHEGYRLAKYNGDYYFILEEGHYYTVTEENIDDHFILEEHVYHPMVVNGVVSDVAFNGVLEDDPYGAIDVESVYTMTSVDATNTLRGGINITKVVKDSDGEEVESDQVFVAEVTLTAPMKDGVPDFTNVENYYADDNVTVLIPSVAWYRYYDREGNVVYDDALIDAGILEDSGQTTEFGRVGQGENYDGSGWFYLDFDDSTGTVTGNVKLVTQYTLRFTNMATGTQYDLTETGTNGMTPSYSFTHRTSVADGEGNFEDDITPDGDTHFVEGNAESNIEVTNTGKWIPLFIYKFGGTDVSEIDNKLAGVQFKLYSDADLKVQVTKDARGTAIGTDGLITTGEDGTAGLGELNPGTYYLVETGLGDNDGYKMLTDAVVIEIGDPIHYEQIGWSPSVQYSSASDPSNLVKANGGLYINYAEDGTTISGYTFTINNKAGVELPMTGGPGTLPYTLGGLMLILGTALLYAFTFRKRSK